MTKVSYKGRLNKRLIIKKKQLESIDELKSVQSEWEERFYELLSSLDVDQTLLKKDAATYWYRVSYLLAVRHVPGLKLQFRSGRSSTWGKREKIWLVAAVEGKLAKNSQLKAEAACRAVSKDTNLSKLFYSKNGMTQKPKTLLRQYREASKSSDVMDAVERFRLAFGKDWLKKFVDGEFTIPPSSLAMLLADPPLDMLPDK